MRPDQAVPTQAGNPADRSQVPEPSTRAMLLAGLGLTGALARRRA